MWKDEKTIFKDAFLYFHHDIESVAFHVKFDFFAFCQIYLLKIINDSFRKNVWIEIRFSTVNQSLTEKPKFASQSYVTKNSTIYATFKKFLNYFLGNSEPLFQISGFNQRAL